MTSRNDKPRDVDAATLANEIDKYGLNNTLALCSGDGYREKERLIVAALRSFAPSHAAVRTIPDAVAFDDWWKDANADRFILPNSQAREWAFKGWRAAAVWMSERQVTPTVIPSASERGEKS